MDKISTDPLMVNHRRSPPAVLVLPHNVVDLALRRRSRATLRVIAPEDDPPPIAS
ncbi:MAG: hypothetical protein AB8G14_01040 [Ilumatobacter sp.]